MSFAFSKTLFFGALILGVIAGAFWPRASISAKSTSREKASGIGDARHETNQQPRAATAAVLTDENRATAAFTKRDFITLEKTLGSWATTDPHGAIAWAKKLPNPYNSEAVRIANLAWFEASPQAAYDWACINDLKVFDDSRFYELAARVSPTLAIAAINTLGNFRELAFNTFVVAWAKADLQAVSDYLPRITDSNARMSATSALVGEWAKNDFAAAFSWTRANTQPGLARDRAFSTAAASAATAGKIEVVLAAIKHATESGENMNGPWRGLAEAMASKSPEQAYDYLLRTTDPHFLGQSIGALVDIELTRPDLVVKLYAQAPDLGNRPYYIGRAVEAWAVKDSAAARAFVEKTPSLTSEQKNALTAKVWPRG